MSKPRLLDAYNRKSRTITSVKSEYAIAMKWSDNNTKNENRLGYFVSSDLTSSDMSIIKATDSSKILGVTVEAPGIATNVPENVCKNDVSHELVSSYAYVCFSGFASVIDNGTCSIGGLCKPSSSGTAVPSDDEGYRVIGRVDNSHVLIHIEPSIGASSSVKIEVIGNRLSIKH